MRVFLVGGRHAIGFLLMQLASDNADYGEWLRRGKRKVFADGQVIYRHGDAAGTMYLVLKGQVSLVNVSSAGRRFVSREAWPGDVFGEECLLPEAHYLYSAETVVRSTVVTLEAAQLVALLRGGGDFARQLTEALSQRLAEAEKLASLLALNHAGERVLGVILGEARQRGSAVWLTHRRLAERAAVARAVVTTTLNRLQREGVLHLDRGVIRLASRPREMSLAAVPGGSRGIR